MGDSPTTRVADGAAWGDLARLREGDVDVWRATLDEVSDDALAYFTTVLSSDEEDRAEEYYFERDRRRFVVSRGILRTLLSGYTGIAAGEIAFRCGPYGKPELGVHDGRQLHFNVAHSEALALFAFTWSGPVGIDVEHLRELPDWESIVRTCFPDEDRAKVRAAAPEARRVEFFRAWTRQEARLKALGRGLGGLGDKAPARPEPYVDGHNPAFHGRGRPALNCYQLQVGDGYTAALAVGSAVRWATLLTCDTSEGFIGGRVACRSRRTPLGQMAKAGIRFL
jgi:4'-phosphopantetheinyl transferase